MKTGQCFASVVIPLFNGEKYIRESLESVLNQTFPDFEIIVVDDGSIDQGARIVREVSDRFLGRIRLLSHRDGKNHGISATRNAGIREARGAWIAFLDQDDRWKPTKLEQQVLSTKTNPEAALIYGAIQFIGPDGSPTTVDGYAKAGKGNALRPTMVFDRLLRENFIPSITVLARKDAVLEMGLFENGPRYEFEDWILWTKLAWFFPFVFLPDTLAEYRLHGHNYSRVRFKSGFDPDADVHYIVSVFSSLLRREGVHDPDLRRQLSSSVRRALLRARSWGVRKEQLTRLGISLKEAFPFLEREISYLSLLAGFVPAPIARLARRLRRRAIRI